MKFRDIINEEENPNSYKFAVAFKDGSISAKRTGWFGKKGEKFRWGYSTEESAKESAKDSNKRLSAGEKKYYGMRYVVVDLEKNKNYFHKVED
jgi:hypothetical protein